MQRCPASPAGAPVVRRQSRELTAPPSFPCVSAGHEEDVTTSGRNRTARLFRSIRKKLKHTNKLLNFRSPKAIAASSSSGGGTPRQLDPDPSEYVDVGSNAVCCTPAAAKGQFGPQRSLDNEFRDLSQHGWYWGPLSKREAEDRLSGLPDGSFLVRDSSSDCYVFTISFRSRGRTLHSRIDNACGSYRVNGLSDYSSVGDLIEDALRQSKPSKQFFYSVRTSDLDLMMAMHAPADNNANNVPGLGDAQALPVNFQEIPPGDAPVAVGGANEDDNTDDDIPPLPPRNVHNVCVAFMRLTQPVSRRTQVRSLQFLCRFVIRQYISVSNVQKLPIPTSLQSYLVQPHF